MTLKNESTYIKHLEREHADQMRRYHNLTSQAINCRATGNRHARKSKHILARDFWNRAGEYNKSATACHMEAIAIAKELAFYAEKSNA